MVRIGFNTWADLYKKMYPTENIQLLEFLRLLKKYGSIFLRPPVSFDGL
jgi:hypothetical protein